MEHENKGGITNKAYEGEERTVQMEEVEVSERRQDTSCYTTNIAIAIKFEIA